MAWGSGVKGLEGSGLGVELTANPGKPEHGPRIISARIPHALPKGREDNHNP